MQSACILLSEQRLDTRYQVRMLTEERPVMTQEVDGHLQIKKRTLRRLHPANTCSWAFLSVDLKENKLCC